MSKRVDSPAAWLRERAQQMANVGRHTAFDVLSDAAMAYAMEHPEAAQPGCDATMTVMGEVMTCDRPQGHEHHHDPSGWTWARAAQPPAQAVGQVERGAIATALNRLAENHTAPGFMRDRLHHIAARVATGDFAPGLRPEASGPEPLEHTCRSGCFGRTGIGDCPACLERMKRPEPKEKP